MDSWSGSQVIILLKLDFGSKLCNSPLAETEIKIQT